MSKTPKQAGKLLFLLLLGVLTGAAAVPQSASAPKGGATGAGAEETFSLEGVWEGLTESIDSLLPSKDSMPSLPASTPKDKTTAQKPAEKPAEPQTIKAKRLDGTTPSAIAPEVAAQTPQAAPPAPPYKVYPSPMLMDDPQPSYGGSTMSREGEASSASAFAGWGTKPPQTIDLSKPPPLPDSLTGRTTDLPAVSAPSVGLPRSRTAASSAAVPPISALPKQFFPVLPLGAIADTPAQLLPVASNSDLEADHSGVSRAVIVIHDMSRNSAENVATLMTLSGADGGVTLILAPQFPLDIDITRFAAHLPDSGRSVSRWTMESGWQWGGESVPIAANQRGVSSFTAIDLLMMYLSDRRRFPSLQQIVLAGHGAGADFVQRYAALGAAPDVLPKEGVDVRFLVANASSYMYMTALRPSASGPSFAAVDPKVCADANNYPYGLGQLTPYARRIGAETIRLRYPERKIVYLIGDKVLGDNYLERNCAAMAQGADRTSRGRFFERHVMQSYGDMAASSQRFAIVPNAGYDSVALFGSYCGMAVLFGEGTCAR